MNVIRDLLRIKDFRENQAEVRVHRQYDLARLAREEHESEQQRLTQMLQEGKEIEQRMYQELCERVVRLNDIENVQLAVAGLRNREAAQQDAVTTAREREDQASQALSEARAAHHEAHRQKTKFTDLSREFDVVSAQEAQRKEDLEMDEAANVMRDRDDWSAEDTDEVVP